MNKFQYYKNLNRIKNRHINAVTVKIVLTWKCQLDCKYCSRHFIGKTYEHKYERQMPAEEWTEKIVKFPIPIDVIYITGGGEPFLYPGIEQLVKELIKLKYCVKIFTNLMKIVDLPISGRLLLSTTIHEPVNKKILFRNIEHYKKQKINVEIYKFDKSLDSDFIQYPGKNIGRKALILHNTEGMDRCLHYPVFNYVPDGTLFVDQESAWVYYKEFGGTL